MPMGIRILMPILMPMGIRIPMPMGIRILMPMGIRILMPMGIGILIPMGIRMGIRILMPMGIRIPMPIYLYNYLWGPMGSQGPYHQNADHQNAIVLEHRNRRLTRDSRIPDFCS